MDAAPQTVYISGKQQDVVQLYFGNSPKSSLLISKALGYIVQQIAVLLAGFLHHQRKIGIQILNQDKYDRISGEPVEGCLFQIKYLSGTSGTGGTVIGTYLVSSMVVVRFSSN